MSRRGLFITLDGPGGAGKTTTVRSLHHRLTTQGYTVHTTSEPSTERLGELARHHTETYRGHALACLVAADRYHHLSSHIRPHLDAGHLVLCDRYVPSTYVLQQMDDVPMKFLVALNNDADRPDLAVFLTADPEITAARIANRGAHSRFETGTNSSVTEFTRYGEIVQRLITDGWTTHTVDTTRATVDQVATAIASRIAQLPGLPPRSQRTG